MDELAIRKAEIMRAMSATELAPLAVDNEIDVQNFTKVPLSRITALGAGLQPVLSAVQQITSNGQAVSGYYKVTIPAGSHLAQFKDGTGFLGTAMNESGIAGQARLNPMVCDPTMLFVAAALANIGKKLDAIQETQREMMDFLVQKEKSALKGDLDFLIDVFNNYKRNWNNDKYKAANHIKVLDIRQNAGRMIDFYREQIKARVGKQNWLHSDQDVKKQLEYITAQFKEYQLALYLYGFGYFLEVLLQKNFDVAYLDSISQKIEDYAFQYRELYTEVFSQIEGYSKTSLQSRFLGGLSVVNKAAGEAIAKIPVISKLQIDETLIDAGHRLGEYGDRRVKTTMRQLVEQQSGCVRPFIENITTINRLYNQPLAIVFNNEALYISVAE